LALRTGYRITRHSRELANERFRDGDIFRRVFERVVATCIAAGLVGGKGFAVDASLIVADANKCRSTPGNVPTSSTMRRAISTRARPARR
jgi:hypothetical protein